MKDKLNLTKLRDDRRALDVRIRALKSALRSRWLRPMASEQRELLACKRESTELCVLRAWTRDRWHLDDHSRCEEIARRRAPAYLAASRSEVA